MNTSDKTRKATDLVQAGIAALKSGRKADARFLLEQALEVDPQSEQSWLWLSGAVDTDEERRFCLTQVLSINEWNPVAETGLKKLGPGPARSPITLPTTTTKPAPPAAEVPVWSQWREQTTSVEATTTPEPPAAEAPAWSQWRDEAASAEAATALEPPAAEAPAWSRRQRTTSTEPTQGSLPKAWLIMTVVLTACILVGLLLLFLVNSGVLGK
jgi:hypothetical protein